MNLRQKEDVVADLIESLAKSQAIFVTDFKGLKVEQMGALRQKVRDAGGTYKVAKNTLIKRAIKGTPAEVLEDMFAGNNALSATDTDPVPLAKSLIEYAKTNDKFVVKGGLLSGKAMTFEQVKALAELPSREILLAQMLGAMVAVPTGFVRVLAAVPQNFLYALSAIRDQKEEAGS